MILDYVIVLFRHLKKHSSIAVVNIVSYGFGIAACLILIQYIYYETSYDNFTRAMKTSIALRLTTTTAASVKARRPLRTFLLERN